MIQTTTNGADASRISWWDKNGLQTARANNVQRLNDATPSKRAREAPKYKGQLSFQGRYWFEALGKLVWHESMAEYSWLMMLDHERPVQAVREQPFIIAFEDGTTHIPDYLAMANHGARSLHDIHPEGLMTARDVRVFAATQRMCDVLGWGYEVRDQMPDITFWNLEMLARYRHPMFAPTSSVKQRILRTATRTPLFGDLRRALATDKPGELLPALTHLMWRRELHIDLERPFTDHSVVTVA